MLTEFSCPRIGIYILVMLFFKNWSPTRGFPKITHQLLSQCCNYYTTIIINADNTLFVLMKWYVTAESQQ